MYHMYPSLRIESRFATTQKMMKQLDYYRLVLLSAVTIFVGINKTLGRGIGSHYDTEV
jgi:hypothetical protein